MTWTDPEIIGGVIAGTLLGVGGFSAKFLFSKNGKPKVCAEHTELLGNVRETRVVVLEIKEDIKEMRQLYSRVGHLETDVEVLKSKQ